MVRVLLGLPELQSSILIDGIVSETKRNVICDPDKAL